MLDFKKLLSQTPEERAEQAKRRDEEFEQRMQEVTLRRQAQVQSMQKLEGLTEWEQNFVSSMVRLAQEVDPISGVVGRKLAYLSDPRIDSFDKLVARTQKPVSPRHMPRPKQ
jgi:hypothetical protein